MAATLDEFLAALRQQESGGNYHVVNGIGAMGAYQVMPFNLANWSRATFGHSISKAEFLSHPEEQDAIARHINGPRFKKYGPAGTAALWYSGQPDPTKTYGNPPVYKYVASVLSLMGKSGSVTGGKNVDQVDNVSGSSVTTAGLQQAGYTAAIQTGDWDIPVNPFKLPGWLAGQLGGGGDSGGDSGGGLASGMWDILGPALLSGMAVFAGLGLVVAGLVLAAKPAVDKGLDRATEAAETVAATVAATAPAAAVL